MRRLATSTLCAFGVLLLAACLDRVAGGGDATETGNALAGTLVVEGGGAAAGARVLAVPEGHHPVLGGALPESLAAYTDARGRYRFKSLPPGRYNLQAFHPATGRRLLIRGLALGIDTIDRGKDVVGIPGSLSLQRPDWVAPAGGSIYVPGTAYALDLGKARMIGSRYHFDSLPPGILPQVRFLSAGEDTADILLAQEPAVASGAATEVHPFAAWSSSARLFLNTTASGIPLERDLRDFPLLVRLVAPYFDPAEARADGSDLRFAKPDGTSLPYEIEAWEPGGVTAWVRLDTLHAGRATQHITAHWGNPFASAPAGRPPVFDTAAGFAGVWHLSEEAADTVSDGLYRDATPAGNHGNDRIASRGRPGVAGPGHSFANGDHIRVPRPTDAVRLARGYTLSAWFRSWPIQGKVGGEMISVGDSYGLRLGMNNRLQTFFWPVKPPPDGQPPWYSVSTLGADFIDGEWHLAMGTFDGGMLRIYLDGREMASLAVPGPVDFKPDLNVTLGRHGQGPGFEFTGDLDEVQIHSRARGSDWHRLSFENQKPGSGFPVLAP